MGIDTRRRTSYLDVMTSSAGRLRSLWRVLLVLPLLAAAAPSQVQLTAQDEADIARIESYLNGIGTMDSRFVQLSANGIAEGRIYLSRPGDLRIEYAPPVPILMIASGRLLMYYDSKLQQTSYLPVTRTPAHFLLRERVDLRDGLTITGFAREPSSLRVTLVDTEDPDAGSITLEFTSDPIRLVSWRVVDPQKQVVEVALVGARFGVELDDDLFSLVDPRLRAGNERD